MKTLEEIFNSEPVFLNDWEDSTQERILGDFHVEDRSGIKILFASYGYADYSGNAFLLFTKDGKLFEVNAIHCSCSGLEFRWDPEETSVDAILMRLIDGHNFGGDEYCGNEFREELLVFLGIKKEEEKTPIEKTTLLEAYKKFGLYSQDIEKRFTGHSDILSQLAFVAINK